MKWKWGLIALTLVASVLIGLATTSPALARCPADDLYCAWWTPTQQAQKVRVEKLNAFIQAAEDRPWLNLGACDAACQNHYDAKGHGILSAYATVNGLPRDKVILAYIVYWDMNAEQADRLLGPGHWNPNGPVPVAEWVNQFADWLRTNHPYAIWGDRFCVTVDYGGAGTCAGKW